MPKHLVIVAGVYSIIGGVGPIEYRLAAISRDSIVLLIFTLFSSLQFNGDALDFLVPTATEVTHCRNNPPPNTSQ